MPDLVRSLLEASPPLPQAASDADLGELWSRVFHDHHAMGHAALAILGGFRAASVGHAFVLGYQAALAALVPAHADGRLLAMCVSEKGGVHPRAMQCRLELGADVATITGSKTFVTMGDAASTLLVLCNAGVRDDGTSDLRMALVPASASGVSLTEGKPLAFVPDVRHGAIELTRVIIPRSAVLVGDGHQVYSRRFRVLEDLFVAAALLGRLVGLARHFGWGHRLAKLAALVAAATEISTMETGSPASHLALAGFMDMSHAALREESDWARAPVELRAAWNRDLALLEIAGSRRAKRAALALAALGKPPETR